MSLPDGQPEPAAPVAVLAPAARSLTLKEIRMRKKKQSFELTFEQTEMLGKFGDPSLLNDSADQRYSVSV